MKIAFIGMGEVGRAYAGALAGRGHAIHACDPAAGPAALDLIRDGGFLHHTSIGPWLGEIDLVFCCVDGRSTARAFAASLPYLRAGTEYVDMTTADPADMRAAAAEAGERSVVFVDIAIIGGISLTGARTPLLRAGTDGERLSRLLEEVEAPVQVLDEGRAGDASFLKLVRSLFTKGLEALAVECLTAAERYQVRDQLFTVLSDIDRTPLRTLLESMIRTHPVHAKRRLAEVETAGALLAAAGQPLIVQPAVRDLFASTVAGLAAHGTPEGGADTALDWLLAIRRAADGEAPAQPA